MKKRRLIFFILASMLFTACSPSGFYTLPENDLKVTNVSLDTDNFSLRVGGSKEITATIFPETEANTKVMWYSSNTSVASVKAVFGTTNKANVNGLSVGEAYITAIAGEKQGIVKVTVGGSSSTSVSAVTLDQTRLNLVVGGTDVMLTPTISPLNAIYQTVTWTSSNPEVATVNNSGMVHPVSKGDTTVTVSVDGVSASCYVFVRGQDEDPDSISIYLDKANATLTIGDTLTLKASTSEPLTVNWQTNDDSVASVGSNGLVTANKEGTAVITATIKKNVEKVVGGETQTVEVEASAHCDITVEKKASEAEYEQSIAQWSKPGHLYIHYLRDEHDYDEWGVWIWQKLPKDLEGSLWGATKWDTTPKLQEIIPNVMTKAWMSDIDVNKGTSGQPYEDIHGQICDIDLTRTDIVDGVGGYASPLYPANRLGFLIVDQTAMNGEGHWTSDGGIEAYIRDFMDLFPDLENHYLHIYCVQNSVSDFSFSSGDTAKVNPTVDDKTGDYRSQNDITNLKRDYYTSGVSTSKTFLDDKPGIGYQIFVPSFADSNGDGTGDIKGITNHLDYLEDLGVKCLWLTPIQESGSYHGYDVTDYYKIDSKFGTIEDYQELIYKAHQRGMKVLMDMVINHTSKSNVLFGKSQRAETEIVNGKEINYRNMYLWKFKGDKVRKWDGDEDYYIANDKQKAKYINVNVEEAGDWYRDGTSDYYYFGKFGSGMAELNYSCQATRDYMTDMCKYWLSFGLDGFRLDAIKHIYLESEIDPDDAQKFSNDNKTFDVGYRTFYDNQLMHEVTAENDYSYDRDLNVKFWKEFAGTIKSAYPNCFLVGENFDGWNQRIAPFYESMDSQFDFSTYYHFNEMGESSIADDVKQTLQYNDAYRGNHINGAFTSNHDVARLLNHAGSTTLKVHSVEINDTNKQTAYDRARYYAAVTLLSPGLSWIYYGDELGFSGNTTDKVKDSSGNIVDDHGNNLDRWYRQPMKWCSIQGEEEVVKYSFSSLEVTWDFHNQSLANVHQQDANPNSMLNYFRELGRIKGLANYPTYGRIKWGGSCGTAANSGAFEISDGTYTVHVFYNNSGSDITPPGNDTSGMSYMGGSVGASISKVPAHGFMVCGRQEVTMMKKKLLLIGLLPLLGLTACQKVDDTFHAFVTKENGITTVYNAPDPEVTTFLLLGEYGYVNFTNQDGTVSKLTGDDMYPTYGKYYDHAIAWKTEAGGTLPAATSVGTETSGASFRGWVVYNNNVYPDYITTVPTKNMSFVIAIFDGTQTGGNEGGGSGGGGGGGGSTDTFTDGVAYIVGSSTFSTGTSQSGSDASWGDPTKAFTMEEVTADDGMAHQFHAHITFNAGDEWKVRYGNTWTETSNGHYENCNGLVSDMSISGDNIKVNVAGTYDIYFKDYTSGWYGIWVSDKLSQEV